MTRRSSPVRETGSVPFTISHTAAILPLARTPLPPAALVLGAMSPDLFYFARIGVPRELSHSILGAITVDLLLALVAFALWVSVVRKPVLDFSPGWLRERMREEARWRSELGWVATSAWLVAAIVVGALTHLTWDLFTHDGSLDGVFPVLAGEIGPLEIDEWSHGASSIVGAIILAVWTRGWVRRTPRTLREGLVGERERVAVWLVAGALFVGTVLVVLIIGISEGLSVLDGRLLFRMAILGSTPPMLITIIAMVAWHLRRRDSVKAVAR